MNRKYILNSIQFYPCRITFFLLTMVTCILNRNWGLQFWVLNLVSIRGVLFVCEAFGLLVLWGFFLFVCLFPFRYRILFLLFFLESVILLWEFQSKLLRLRNSNFVLIAVSRFFTIISNHHCKIWHHDGVREKAVIFLITCNSVTKLMVSLHEYVAVSSG